jgi:hypothetical protein
MVIVVWSVANAMMMVDEVSNMNCNISNDYSEAGELVVLLASFQYPCCGTVQAVFRLEKAGKVVCFVLLEARDSDCIMIYKSMRGIFGPLSRGDRESNRVFLPGFSLPCRTFDV